jgi:hypothetical protein
MKKLLFIMGIVEGGTGLLLVALPTFVATILLGSPLDTPVSLTVMRVAGVAVLALGVACFLARNDGGSRAARGLVNGMLVYNAGVVAALLYAGLGLGLSCIGLWLVVLIHLGMTVWCIMCLMHKQTQY